tara:strand:- start:1960 stop:2388 length:429 start_codon:yes stop_codon:yes gene_type:complete
MSELNIEHILKALENEDNENILQLDHEKISKMKNDILQKLGLPREKLKQYHKSLKNYRFIDELPDLHYGSYIRWITIKDPENIKLTNGGIVCEMKVGDDGIIIVCKNKINRFFSFKMNETLIFQRLSEQEQVLLSALDYLNA